MAGYMIAMVDVTDMEQYREYMKLTPALVEKVGGKFLTRGGAVTTLEGELPAPRMVLLEFPSHDVAVEFYNSAEYQAAKAVRSGAATGTFIALEGL